VFIADAALDIVCKVDATTKNISRYAGTLNNPGAPGGANGDGGPATSAQISAPNGLAVIRWATSSSRIPETPKFAW
jgi:hypothetical protein